MEILNLKSTPFLIPPPPENDEDVIRWATDMTRIMTDVLGHWQEKYNRLIDELKEREV